MEAERGQLGAVGGASPRRSSRTRSARAGAGRSTRSVTGPIKTMRARAGGGLEAEVGTAGGGGGGEVCWGERGGGREVTVNGRDLCKRGRSA